MHFPRFSYIFWSVRSSERDRRRVFSDKIFAPCPRSPDRLKIIYEFKRLFDTEKRYLN